MSERIESVPVPAEVKAMVALSIVGCECGHNWKSYPGGAYQAWEEVGDSSSAALTLFGLGTDTYTLSDLFCGAFLIGRQRALRLI